MTDTQIRELRALTSVHKLTSPFTGQDEAEFYHRMLQPGHACQWTSLGEERAITVTAPLAAVLGTVPTLTSLNATLVRGPVQFLAELRALTSVCLAPEGRPFLPSKVDPTTLVAALCHCTAITNLRLSGFGFTAHHLDDLLPAFPRLSSLSLADLPELESLRCLATAALASSLQDLRLSVLPSCSSSAVARLLGLRSLQQLTLTYLWPDMRPRLDPVFRNRQRFPQLTDYHWAIKPAG